MPELNPSPKFPITEKPRLSPNPKSTLEYKDGGRGTPVIVNTDPAYQGSQDTDQNARISVLEGKMAQAESDIDAVQEQTFVASFDGKDGAITTDGTLETNSSKVVGLTGQLPYLTSEPSDPNTAGFVKLVVLDSDPSDPQEGFLYFVTEPAE